MIPEEARVIYTIGHSTLPSRDFIALLEYHVIRTVADVRRFPTSRKNPQYAEASLRQTLNASGVQYVWLGDDLGGYRSGGYEAYMQAGGFRQGIARLEELAGRSTTAIMCAEKLSTRCHRRFISNALLERGWRVIHILDESTHCDHTLQPTLL